MSKPTLPQAISLLNRANDKNLTSAQLETHFSAGLLSDLLDIDPTKVDRNEYRKVIGHPDVAAPAILKPTSTIIVAKRPFNPTAIFGSGWTIWLGSEDGDGLAGDEERDELSRALDKLDLSLVEPTILLRKGESYTTSVEQITRIKSEKADHVRLDPCFALALRDEPEKYPDAWKGKAVFWDGLTLRGPRGYRCSVDSRWSGGGVELFYRWHDGHRDDDSPSALLASKHLAPSA